MAQHDDPVGALGGDAEVVGDEEDARAVLAPQVVDEVEHGALHRRVEGTRRLVGDDEPGPQGDRAGDEDALAHPAGQLVRVRARDPVGVVEADALEQAPHLGVDAAAVALAVDAQHLADLPADGLERVEGGRRILRDQPDLLAEQPLEPPAADARDVGAAERHPAADKRGAPGEQPDRRHRRGRLAGSGLADEGDGLAGLDGQVDAVDGDDAAAPGLVGDHEVAHLEHAHRRTPRDRLIRFAERTTSSRTRPGKAVTHHAAPSRLRPWAMIMPHSGSGGCTP